MRLTCPFVRYVQHAPMAPVKQATAAPPRTYVLPREWPTDEEYDELDLDCAFRVHVGQPLDRTPTVASSERVASLGDQNALAVLQSVYHKPINEAAKDLGIGVTVLKKQCRHHGIQRWPYRKLSSIAKLVQNVKEVRSLTYDWGSVRAEGTG